MKKVYIASGYNSLTNKDVIRAFSSEKEADAFLNGLTNCHIQVIAYKSCTQLVNALLGVTV